MSDRLPVRLGPLDSASLARFVTSRSLFLGISAADNKAQDECWDWVSQTQIPPERLPQLQVHPATVDQAGSAPG